MPSAHRLKLAKTRLASDRGDVGVLRISVSRCSRVRRQAAIVGAVSASAGRQGKGAWEPRLEPHRQEICARFISAGDIARQMREAGLLCVGMPSLGGMTIREPDRRPMAIHHVPDHHGAPRWRRLTPKHPATSSRADAVDFPATGVGRNHRPQVFSGG